MESTLDYNVKLAELQQTAATLAARTLGNTAAAIVAARTLGNTEAATLAARTLGNTAAATLAARTLGVIQQLYTSSQDSR